MKNIPTPSPSGTAQKIVTFSAIGTIIMMAGHKGWITNITNGIRHATGN